MPSLLLWAVLFLAPFARATDAPEIGNHYVFRCTIVGEGGAVLKRFPAKMCVFLEDGSFVAATNDPIRLARIGPTGGIIWTRALHVHHQLKLSRDGKRLFALGAEVREGDFGKVRYDDFLVLSVTTGETLHRWSGYDHRKDYLKLTPRVPAAIRPADSRENLDYLYEYTHFNSIDEIPESPLAQSLPAFKKGNLLVGLAQLGMFAILDPELKGIRWTMNAPLRDGDDEHHEVGFHDVQLLPNGHLLVFYNKVPKPQEHFSLREIDPLERKIVWEYPKGGGPAAEVAGGLQSVPEGVLFNLNLTIQGKLSGAAFLVDRGGRILWSFQDPSGQDSRQMVIERSVPGEIGTQGNPFQDIKKFDLTKFLRNNRIR